MRAVEREIPEQVPYDDLIEVAEAARLTGYSRRAVLAKSLVGDGFDRWPFSSRRIMIIKSSIDRALLARRKIEVERQPELFFPS
jgi:hypothetical protein